MPVPIWKDHTVQLGAADACDFEIRLGTAAGQLLYSGRSYRRPGAAQCEARINDVCADYLQPDPFTTAVETFVVLSDAAGSMAAVETVAFYADWSYDYNFDPATMPLAAPIDAVLDPRQLLLFSTLGAGPVSAVIAFADGTTQTVQLSMADPLDLSEYPGAVAVTVDGHPYQVREMCGPVALYYVNAYGGWDSFVPKGRTGTRKDITRHTSLTGYDNADASARGIRDYANEVAPAWELHTGLLDPDQAERLHHLMTSPLVCLHDFVEGLIRPVVLTDGAVDLRGDGKLADFTINAKLAQEQFRR